ncbi:MAG: hypothetical protein ABIH23_17885, partial [bacterium]
LDMVDWDGDGDLDFLISGSRGGDEPEKSLTETRNIVLYENIADDDASFIFRYNGDITAVQLEGHTTCPTTTDWDNDGIRDLLVGAEDGFFYVFPRTSQQERMGKQAAF